MTSAGRPSIGRRVLERHLSLSRSGGAGMAADVVERRRPKLLPSVRRLLPEAPLSRTPVAGAPAPAPSAAPAPPPAAAPVEPEPEVVLPPVEGVSDGAAQWLFTGDLPDDAIPFLGAAMPDEEEAPKPETPRRLARTPIPRGRVVEGDAPRPKPAAPAAAAAPPPEESTTASAGQSSPPAGAASAGADKASPP